MDSKASRIQVKCDLNPTLKEKLIAILPDFKTRITHVGTINADDMPPVLQVKLSISAHTPDEVLKWVEDYEEQTKTTYSVRCTDKCTGRYVDFKQRRICQHNTRYGRSAATIARGVTKNTNCPSRMTLTLKAIKTRHRYKNDSDSPDPEFPCTIEIITTHNHQIDSPQALRLRPVCDTVRQKLVELYKIGHTPATALECLKIEIRMKYEDCETILTDRKYCPDYQYCYYVYSVFKEENEDLAFKNKGREVVTKLLKDFNATTSDSAEIFIENNDYVICICPPLIKRVHQYVSSSSDMVLMDSCKPSDGSRVYILLSYSECGGLPLGIVVTSSENVSLIIKGLQLLQHMMGDTIFNGSIEGPRVFLTNDNSSERLAIKTVWPKSKTLLSSFDVLQTVWKWLIKKKNDIPQEIQHFFFQEFKAILHAATMRECLEKYSIAKNSAQSYPNYCKYLDDFWKYKELWTLCHRNMSLKEKQVDNFYEVAMKFLKEKIFHDVKAFNVVQMVYFMTTKFLDIYKARLLNAAHNQLNCDVLNKPFVQPPEGLLERIQCLSDNMALVPSEDEHLYYIVNTDVLMCTCFNINTIRICRHVDWACSCIYPQRFMIGVNNLVLRSMYYTIAVGDWLMPLDDHENDRSQVTAVYVPENEVSEVETHSNYQEDVNTCKNILEHFVQIVTPFTEKSPKEMLPALERMKETARSFQSISEVVSALSTFGDDVHKDAVKDMVIPQNGMILNKKRSPTKERPRSLLISRGSGKGYLLSKRILVRLKESHKTEVVDGSI